MPPFFVERKFIMKNHNKILKLTYSALFLALAYVLPFLTGQIPEIGAMLCPMHIPAILCGFICGWPYGLAVGFVSPILRSLVLSMPPMFPTAVCMAFELATYGAVSGILHKAFPKKKIYILWSLIISMLAGRLVWGIAMYICMGINGGAFGLAAFVAGAFVNAVPGIIAQIIIIPVLVAVLEKTTNISKGAKE